MESGEAAEDALTLTNAQEDLIEEHEESAEATQVWFTALTVILLLLVVVPPVLGRRAEGKLPFCALPRLSSRIRWGSPFPYEYWTSWRDACSRAWIPVPRWESRRMLRE